MPVTTLKDLEAQTQQTMISTDASGTLLFRVGNTVWSLNVMLWLILMVVANIMHPPAFIMLALNSILLLLNMDAVRKAGTANTPTWLYVIIALQLMITLQYAGWTLQSVF